MRRYSWSLLLLLIVLAACGEDEVATPTAPPATATATVTPTPAGTATPTPTETPAPSPTPPAPALAADDQPLDESGELTLTVTGPDPAWVAVYTTDDDGAPLTLLGVAPAPAGADQPVLLTIDPYAATDTLVAILYEDVAPTGEFTAEDSAITADGAPLQAIFAVDVDVPLPEITVSAQALDQSGVVLIDEVTATEPGWLALYADRAGDMGPLLGFTTVRAGRNQGLVVQVVPLDATPLLHAVFHRDAGEIGRFEPAVDPMLLISGVPLEVAFPVTLPLDAFALDQPVVDGTVVVERAVVNEPAWLAIYYNAPDRDNRIIGFALLEPGINENIVVEVDERLITAELLIVFHRDAEDPGLFEFPGADEPILENDRLPEPFTFRTDQGSYVVSRDQDLVENGVTLPLVVVTAPTWLVVYNTVDSERGAILGTVFLERGIHRDVVVSMAGDVTDTLIAVLHADRSDPGVFEFPAEDPPLQRNGNDLAVPFEVVTGG